MRLLELDPIGGAPGIVSLQRKFQGLHCINLTSGTPQLLCSDVVSRVDKVHQDAAIEIEVATPGL